MTRRLGPTALLVSMLFLLILSWGVRADVPACRGAEGKAQQFASWQDAYRYFKQYKGWCIDGALGEEVSEGITRLLDERWADFGELATLARQDEGFAGWVIEEFNGSDDECAIVRAVANLNLACPAGNELLCRKLAGQGQLHFEPEDRVRCASTIVSPSERGSTATPPKLYADWGACPFEGCCYGQWRAVRRTAALSKRHDNAPLAFYVAAGRGVKAISGVVITTRPGRIKVVSSTTLGEKPNVVSLYPGDTVYTLHYLGEGYELFWFKGRVYRDQISSSGLGPIPSTLPVDPLDVLELPTTQWWVELRLETGEVGWSRHPEDFELSSCD